MRKRPIRIATEEEYVARQKAAGRTEEFSRQWATTAWTISGSPEVSSGRSTRSLVDWCGVRCGPPRSGAGCGGRSSQ